MISRFSEFTGSQGTLTDSLPNFRPQGGSLSSLTRDCIHTAMASRKFGARLFHINSLMNRICLVCQMSKKLNEIEGLLNFWSVLDIL